LSTSCFTFTYIILAINPDTVELGHSHITAVFVNMVLSGEDKILIKHLSL